jgi:uncharacterized membrane protein
MKKLVLLALMLGIMGISFCLQDAKSIDAYIEISSDLKVFQRLNFTIVNAEDKNASSIFLMMPYMPKNFEVLDNELKALNYSTSISNGIFIIKINEPMLSGSEKNYIIRIYDDSFVTNFGNSNIFTYSFLSYYNLDFFTMKLVLPKNYAIASSQGSAISPLPNKLYSSNDEIALEWSQKMSYMESKSFFVFFEKTENNNFSWLVIAITFTLSFFIGAATIYFFFKKNKSKTITQILSKDEKAVFDLLFEKKHLTQKEIGEILDLSKPKLSKLINALSKKGIISITPQGRKNNIELKKEVL